MGGALQGGLGGPCQYPPKFSRLDHNAMGPIIIACVNDDDDVHLKAD